jgi:PAS domain S-box-containing protein
MNEAPQITVLVVDDYGPNRSLVNQVLSREGFRVREAGDGVEALDILERARIDAIISDILMPNMDGYRLCTEVRRSEKFANLPFIFYTNNYTSASDEAMALELGADKFIRNPGFPAVVVLAVRELVSGPPRVHAAVAPRPDLDRTREYTQRLVEKLEEKNGELVRRTQELRATSDKLQAVIRAAPMAIISFDQAGKVTAWNPAAERIFGWSEAEVLGRRPLHLGVEAQGEFERLRQRVQAGETIVGLEVRRCRRDGTPVDLELNAAPLRDAEGNVVGKMAALADITERKRAEARLKKSEGLLAEAQALAHIGSWEWDTRADVVIWSDELYRMMGLRPQERAVSYSYFLTLVHAGDRDRVDQVIQQAFRDHQPFEYKYRTALPDGTTATYRVKGVVICDDHDHPDRLHGTMQDITAQSVAEEALRESEQRFAAFMDNQPAFAWMKDLEGRYVYANKVTEQLPEYRSGWKGKTDADILPAGIAVENRANDQKVISSGQAIQTVERYLVEDEMRHMLVNKFPIFDRTGAIVMVGGVSVDITKRIRAEGALRESEERFRQLAENIDEVIWIRNVEGWRLEFVSPAYARIWKRSVEDLHRQPDSWIDAIHSDDRERLARVAEQLPTTGEYDLTYRVVWPDGSIRWIRDRAFPVRNGQGSLVRIAGIAEDITERKRAEQQVENFAEMLKILTNRLFEAQEEERHHLARELHDEIGQSLTAAKLDIEAAKQLDDPAARALRLDDGLAVIEHLLQSVRALSLGLRPALLDEVGLAAALLAHAQSQAARGGLAVRLAVDKSLPRCEPALEIACFRVAQEALTNVLRHARAKTVEIALRRCGDELQLRVRDDGVGFDVALANARAASGASFGLLSMRERVNLAGGTFVCKSAAGQGTEVEACFLLTTTRTENRDEKAAPRSGG